VTLEGIEGSGKSTQISALARFLTKNGFECVVTREPGGTPIGKKIRALLLDPDNHAISPHAELLLYVADRIQHVHEVIRPALEKGKTVLCDRYFDATLVYQGMARGLGTELIADLHKRFLDNLKPDVTVLLDLSPETGLKRAWRQFRSGERNAGETRFEEEALTFHEKVRQGYLEMAAREPDRFRIVDAAQSEIHVKNAILEIMTRVLDNQGARKK
jgi:dTMP kinase